MADPLSAVGTAVGVLSLGIQVCQGLIRYLDAVKGQNREAEVTRRQVQNLHSVFDIFRQTYPQLECYDKATARILEKCLLESREQVEELEALLEAIAPDSRLPEANSVKATGKRVIRQLRYPFHQKSVRAIQERIQIVLLSLHTATQGISLQYLSAIHRTLVPREESAHNTRSIASLRGINSQTPNVDNLATQQCSHVQAEPTKMELPNPAERRGRPPGTLGELYGTNCGVPSWLTGDSEPPIPEIDGDPACRICQHGSKSCGIVATYSREYGGISFWTLTNSHSHLRSCPLYIRSYEVIVRILFVLWVQQILRVLLQISFKMEARRGGFVISPSLTWKPIIRWDAPILQLCNFEQVIGRCWETGVLLSEAEIVHNMRSMERKIFDLFRQGQASPYDMTENGLTLIHVLALRWSHAASLVRRHLPVVDQIAKMIKSVADAGVPVYERAQLNGETAFEMFIGRPPLMLDRASEAPWVTDSIFYSTIMEFRGDHDELSSEEEVHEPVDVLALLFLRSDIVKELSISALAKAILTRSKTKLRSILLDDPGSVVNMTWGLTALHLSCTWAVGLEMILDFGGRQLINVKDRLGRPPFAFACRLNCPETLRIFIREGCEISSLSFPRFRIWEYEPEVVDLLIITIAARRNLLRRIADTTFPSWFAHPTDAITLPDLRASEISTRLMDRGVYVPGFLRVSGPPRSVYDAFQVLPVHFPAFFRHGFGDLNSHNCVGLTPIMTALCLHSSAYLGLDYSLRFVLPVLSWLQEKGCMDATARDPQGISVNVSASGWHYLAASMGRGGMLGLPAPPPLLGRSSASSIMSILSLVFGITTSDGCVCWCSTRGCTPFLAFCKIWNEQTELGWDAPSQIFDCVFQAGKDHYSAAEFLRLRQEFVRLITFEALGLTHTCCATDQVVMRSDSDRITHGNIGTTFEEESQQRHTQQTAAGSNIYEISVYCEPNRALCIRDEEISLAGTLDSLMSEFERHLASHEDGVMEFVHGYWKKQMREACEPGAEGYRALEEVGARMKPLGTPTRLRELLGCTFALSSDF